MIHYAPYGKNAAGKFICGAEDGGYTEKPSYVTCQGCKDESPGMWPKNHYQTITLVLDDGRRVSYCGRTQLDHWFPVQCVEIIVSISKPLPEDCSWSTIESMVKE